MSTILSQIEPFHLFRHEAQNISQTDSKHYEISHQSRSPYPRYRPRISKPLFASPKKSKCKQMSQIDCILSKQTRSWNDYLEKQSIRVEKS